MNDFIYWLILSSLALMLFYGIYRLLLNRFTLLNAGRAYLLITMFMALLIPLPWQRLMESPAEVAFVINLNMATIIPEMAQTESSLSLNWMKLLLLVYLAPASLLFGFFVFSNLKILLILHRGKKLRKQNVRIILHDHDLLPFSWFGHVVLSRKDYESPHAESILAHEFTHIRQHHFIDLLLAEILIVLQWFNPAAWHYRAAVRDVHEYLADKGTLQTGFRITEYQRILAMLAGPVTAGILSNNIKHSTLKNRFTMMTKTNNGKLATLRFTTAIVAAALIGFGIFVTACQTGTQQTEKTPEPEIVIPETTADHSTPEDPGEVFIVVEDPPQFPGGDEARIKYLLEIIKYPEEARNKGIQGTVFVTFIVEPDGSVSDVKILRGIGGGCDEEAMRVIKSMPNWIPGKQRGQAVRVQFNMPVRFVLE